MWVIWNKQRHKTMEINDMLKRKLKKEWLNFMVFFNGLYALPRIIFLCRRFLLRAIKHTVTKIIRRKRHRTPIPITTPAHSGWGSVPGRRELGGYVSMTAKKENNGWFTRIIQTDMGLNWISRAVGRKMERGLGTDPEWRRWSSDWACSAALRGETGVLARSCSSAECQKEERHGIRMTFLKYHRMEISQSESGVVWNQYYQTQRCGSFKGAVCKV